MILLTGGLGYLGSHMAARLVKDGHDVVLVDNLSNSNISVLHRLTQLVGHEIPFVQMDVRVKEQLQQIFEKYMVTSVVHFAGSKSVNESISQPLDYYDNNVNGLISLLEVMKSTHVKTIVFSSTAAIYGEPESLPIVEDAKQAPITPYGRSKQMCEFILQDLSRAEQDWRIAVLRYFNPAGAHESGLIGEIPHGIPNNLMPYIAQVARAERPYLQVFGDDYATIDGTGVRDYIHVQDLISGHVQAITWLTKQSEAFEILNLGRGEGISVMQMLNAFSKAVGHDLPYQVVPRRQGDSASVYADVSHAKRLLGWEAMRTVDDMAIDMWRFYQGLNAD
ncbi:UDP-glucose 4-epimerase GalE [Aquirhabdus sp.]|uniref:UDP-glucose 4-epimerase GalE n=1 Tax=Aquirhabdus sp. TaxID=2824160 RepID=UPI00396C9642